MRSFVSASLLVVGCSIVSSLVTSRAQAENKIGLTAFEQAAPAQLQVGAAGGTPMAAPTMQRTMPRFVARSVAAQTSASFPWRPAIQPQGQRPARRVAKPFEQVDRDPTISPYLNLDRDDDEQQVVPNYFTLVRPQLEQMQTNRLQQRELQQLRGQVQGMAISGAAPQGAYRTSGNGSSARFMDTAQFYGGGR